ncbi:trypsin-like peptidase domain-containing protein, partial [Candidatus Saccharibacteria bacterium]|nr:trypsin-like peptidase domain-containing protein [Candidatus Saccharibacteria bacterium]
MGAYRIKSPQKIREERDKYKNKWSFPKRVTYYLFWVAAWAIIGVLAVLGLGWLTGVQLGFDTFAADTSDSQDSQVLFWVTLWGFIIFFAIWRWLKRRKDKDFWRVSANILAVFIALGLIGGAISSVNLHRAGVNKNQATPLCDMHTTLNKAITATYPISTPSGAGTAFAVDANGTLVTAYHVIEDEDIVYMDLVTGRENLQILRTSPEYDLALLKYAKPTPDFLRLIETTELAEQIYALGYPANAFYSGRSTISSGVVSRIITNEDAKRNFESMPADISFIQTDAAVNLGNSGG